MADHKNTLNLPDTGFPMRGDLAKREPFLRRTLGSWVVEAQSPMDMTMRIIAHRLSCAILPLPDLLRLLDEGMDDAALFESVWAADLLAVLDRDPACINALHAVLNLKGFHALVAHRFSAGLWRLGRREAALWVANRIAAVLSVDVHPAAQLGRSLLFDHAAGIVIGETAVVEDGVSIFQNVTLGGTGKEQGDRHPKIRRGVLLGAGAKVLGNIEVGAMSKVAAGSVVLSTVPPYCTVAGTPAKVVGRERSKEAA